MQNNSQSISEILDERGKAYGEWSAVARTAQSIKQYVRPSDLILKESVDMIASKLARVANGNQYHLDSWRDIAGYAELAVRYIEGME